MSNIEAEIEYYLKNPGKLLVYSRYIVDLYGKDGYNYIREKIKNSSKKNNWRKYRKAVQLLTEQQPLHLLENIEKRGFSGYHVDHIVSIWQAFKEGWPPEKTANISNLRCIPCEENMRKGRKNTIQNNILNEE